MEFLRENLLVVLALFIGGALLIYPLARRSAIGPRISALEASVLLNRADGVVLDVREAPDFAQGHAPDAVHVPLAQLAARLAGLQWPRERPVIVCAGSEGDAGRAVRLLREAGYGRACELAGGMTGWRDAGMPVQSG